MHGLCCTLTLVLLVVYRQCVQLRGCLVQALPVLLVCVLQRLQAPLSVLRGAPLLLFQHLQGSEQRPEVVADGHSSGKQLLPAT